MLMSNVLQLICILDHAVLCSLLVIAKKVKGVNKTTCIELALAISFLSFE